MSEDRSMQRELLASIEEGDLERVRGLIAQGADVNFRGNDPDGETPLMRAIQAGRLEATRVLLEAGAEVSCAGKVSGWTPLMLAHQQPKMIAELVKFGADVQARSFSREIDAMGKRVRRGGETALHLAAVANNAEAVRALSDAGSEVEALDASGNAPLDIALRAGAVTPVAELLVKAGAKLSAERLEVMHSGGYEAHSELKFFPEIDVVDLSGRKELATVAPKQGTFSSGIKCGYCGALTYSRKARICGSCGKTLAPEVGLDESQSEAMGREREWAQKLADKFDPKRREEEARERWKNSVMAETPSGLLREFSYAEEFRRRRRPAFWMQLAGYGLFLTGLQVVFVQAKLPVSPMLIVVGAVLLGAALVRGWIGANPVCPNCRSHVKCCAERFCCVCGKAIANGRCAECAPRDGVLSSGGSGPQWIRNCPNCGVWLDAGLCREDRPYGWWRRLG